jgi:hypothetical protein
MTDFTTCLLRDPKLSQITDKQVYAVTQGASNSTFQQFQAVSANNSSIVWNVQVPSQSIVVNREVQIRARNFTFYVKVDGGAVGDTVFDLGIKDALAPFPLTMLMNTLSSQINNTNVSETISDILPQLLRMNDSRELYAWNSGTPTLPDQAYHNYSDAYGASNNPLAGFSTSSYDVCQVPRGSFPPVSCVISQYNPAVSTTVPVVVAPGVSPALIQTAGNYVIAQLVYDLIEPIFLSPFIFSNPEYNLGGLVGINTLNLVCQLNSGQRMFRSGSGFASVVNLGTYGGASTPFVGQCELLLNFLSTQSTDLIPSRSVVPYMSYPRYLTTATTAFGNFGAISPNSPDTATITSANLQLNAIPDKFIICVRKPMNSQTTADADCFFRINSVAISLNNQSGLLSTATNYDLWRLSCEAGSSQTFLEFSGRASNNDPALSAGTTVSTTGSLLVLSPSQSLSLPAMLSAGSIGQFNFQISLNVTNLATNQASSALGGDIRPEIVILTANSGIMVNQNGSSAVYTGILTRQMVVDTATGANVPSVEIPEYTRMVGGKMSNMGAFKNMAKKTSRGAAPVAMGAGNIGSGMVGSGVGRYC